MDHHALNLARLPEFAFAGTQCVYTSSLLDFKDLRHQSNFYLAMHNHHPQLANSIYNHNAQFNTLASDIEAYNMEYQSPAKVISQLITDLRPVGTQVTF